MAELNLQSLFQKLPNAGIPYTYTVGGPSSSTGGGLPVNVKLSLDPQFQKTVMNVATILGVSIGGGLIGIALLRRRRN